MDKSSAIVLEAIIEVCSEDTSVVSSPSVAVWTPCGSENKEDKTAESEKRDETDYLCSPTPEPVPKVYFIYAKRCEQLKVNQSEKHFRSLTESLATSHQQDLISVSRTLNDELVVHHATFGACGTTAVCSTIPFFPECSKVVLDGNNLTAWAIKSIVTYLCQLKHLSELVLSSINLNVIPEKIIVTLLVSTRTLKKLDISGNRLNDKTAASLLEQLIFYQNLEELNLSKNLLGLQSCQALEKLLGETASLKILDCGWNEIRGPAAMVLAKGLKENYGLQYLDISWNGIGNNGAWAIGNWLKEAGQLLSLNLSSNRIEAIGLAGLFLGLAENDVLRELILSRNPLSETAVRESLYALASGLSRSVLETLDFQHIDLGFSFDQVVQETKQFRPKLTCLWSPRDPHLFSKFNQMSVNVNLIGANTLQMDF
ncbi:hypothetical protein FGIG_08594 [Fasciola gigantica]|uniref:Uncharacterized protein n=1 Tax=Fasciola gigantica TaxID=46835 RepID=A0A504YGY4_FASGI|nr:hypothetical protein FGIG_08594 [Fasciola gigantica]